MRKKTLGIYGGTKSCQKQGTTKLHPLSAEGSKRHRAYSSRKIELDLISFRVFGYIFLFKESTGLLFGTNT